MRRKFFKQQRKEKCEIKGKGEENCVWRMFYFSIDNKEEMFIRSASVQAAHNSLLNIQYIFHTHTIQLSTSGKKCVPNHPPQKKKENLPYLENFQFSTSTNVFSDIILHILQNMNIHICLKMENVYFQPSGQPHTHPTHISTHITQISLSLLHSLQHIRLVFFLEQEK